MTEQLPRKLLNYEGPEGVFLRACALNDAQLVSESLFLVPLEAGDFTPIHLAAHYGADAVMPLLLANGANPNALDFRSRTPLHLAAYSQIPNAEIIRQLIAAGADRECLDSSQATPLQLAFHSLGTWEVTRTLIELGCNVNAAPGEEPFTFGETRYDRPFNEIGIARPLYLAVRADSLPAVNLLLDKGADINALSFGWTALHAAATFPNPQMIELLLQRGADLTIKSADGRTPIELLEGYCRSANLLRAAMLPRLP